MESSHKDELLIGRQVSAIIRKFIRFKVLQMVPAGDITTYDEVPFIPDAWIRRIAIVVIPSAPTWVHKAVNGVVCDMCDYPAENYPTYDRATKYATNKCYHILKQIVKDRNGHQLTIGI